MILSTWTKESKGLFQLKAPASEIEKSHFYLTESRIFSGNPKDSKFYFTKKFANNEFTSSLRKFKIILDPKDHQRNYLSNLTEEFTASKRLWMATEEEDLNEETRLQEEQMVRFGRQIIKISKIYRLKSSQMNKSKTLKNKNGSQNSIPALTNRTTHRALSPQDVNLINSEQLTCRICLDAETIERPFETDMCLCSNNMPAHFDCLIKWLQKKCEQTSKGKATYFDLEKLKCDICKQAYKPIVSFRGEEINLLDIKPSDDKPAFLIEVYNTSGKTLKGVFFIQIDEKVSNIVSIGRTSKSDLRFNDASVSRNHAKLVWHQNDLYVVDMKSKFGTCRLMPSNFPLVQAENKKFLIDKFMVSFHVMLTKKHCLCFKKGFTFVTNPLDNFPMLQIEEDNLIEESARDLDDSLPLEVNPEEPIANVNPVLMNRSQLSNRALDLGENLRIDNVQNAQIQSENSHLPLMNLAANRESIFAQRFQFSHEELILPKNSKPVTDLNSQLQNILANQNEYFKVEENNNNIIDKINTNGSYYITNEPFVLRNDRFTEPEPIIPRAREFRFIQSMARDEDQIYDYHYPKVNDKLSSREKNAKGNGKIPKLLLADHGESNSQIPNQPIVKNNFCFDEETEEKLLFSNRTASHLEFDQCENFEFN
jgi:hypothetical protein